MSTALAARVVPGYRELEVLSTSTATVVCRARRECDGLRVVVKALREELPEREAIEALRREYAMLTRLAIPQVARAVELVSLGAGLALVMEDSGGVPAEVVARRHGFGQADFLVLAVAASRALEAVHRRGVLHRDLKPAHLLVEGDGAVRLIDFGLALELGDGPLPVSPDAIEGTLAYISPEQTGRMGRGVDLRSDLYGLGVTLFELWTGRLPFPFVDALELVHGHLARTPPRADELRPETDATVASILARLLAKAPEGRYQTAAGLAADLERCLDQLRGASSIVPFELGERDAPRGLRLPVRLYGREEPLRRLEVAAAEVLGGATRVVLLGGASGVGKSSLVASLRTALAGRVLFGSGKFNQLQGGRPYPALADACREVVRQLLREPGDVLARRREQLLAALGPSAGVVAEVVPDLSVILGETPRPSPVGPIEAQHRFEEAFSRLLKAVAAPGAPLVLFLDDLQWADAASLRLLRGLVTAPGQPPWLLIGAYREGDTEALEPLVVDLERHAPSPLRRVSVRALSPEDVGAFAAEALSRDASEVQALAEVLFRKTGGNPLYLGQFLLALERDGLLRVEDAGPRWVWDLPAIEARRVTDNVADLVLDRLRGLPWEARRALGVAACQGREVAVEVLVEVAGLARLDLEAGLERAVREGLLVAIPSRGPGGVGGPGGRRLEFAHDRLWEAARGLLSASEQVQAHLALGRALLGRLREPSPDGPLFAAAQQLNLARASLAPVELRAVVELNLRCARRAQATAAPAVALEHLGVALELLGDSGWAAHQALAFTLHLTRAECEYVTGHHERALAQLDELAGHAQELLQRVAVGNLRTLVLTNLGDFPRACDAAAATLRWLGVELPEPSDVAAVDAAIGDEFAALQGELAGRSIDSLRALPELTEPRRAAELATVAGVIPAAYQSNQPLMVLLVLKGTRVSLRCGAADVTPFLLAQYAIAHLAITGDHRAAYRWGSVALELGQARPNQAALGAVHFLFAGFVGHWCEPIAESLRHFEVGRARCLESGDLLHAAYCVGLGLGFQVHAGRPLPELAKGLPAAAQALGATGDLVNHAYLTMVKRYVAAMEGSSERPGSLDGDGFLEAEFEAQTPPIVHSWFRCFQAMARYHAGDFEGAVALASARRAHAGLIGSVDASLYEGLARAALARAGQGAQRARHLARLEELLRVFRDWSELCPANQGHRLALLEGEVARTTGRSLHALGCFEAAVAQAQAQGHWLDSALACELAGELHVEERRPRTGRHLLVEAVRGYRHYGAEAKAAALEQRHARLGLDAAGELASDHQHPSSTSTTAGRGAGLALDLESAMRAARAIASELATDRLIERLLQLVMESAGAARVALLLPAGDDLHLAAERSVEPEAVSLGLDRPLSGEEELPAQLVRYVARTREAVVSGPGGLEATFLDDPYILRRGPKSVLGLPLVHQGQLRGVLYLEHRTAPRVFSPARVERIRFLAGHAASALVNAQLFSEVQVARRELEGRVEARTRELSQRNQELRGVLDAVAQGLVTLDEGGRVAGAVSAQAAAWFGAMPEGTLLLDVLASLGGGGARTAAEPPRGASVVGGEAAWRERVPPRLAVNGRTLSLETRPVDGAPAPRTLLVVSDVTDEERQKQLEVELRHAQKLESVGQLAAGIAHEINTPAQFVGDSVGFLADAFGELRGVLAKYRELVARAGLPDAMAQELAQAEAAADLPFVEEHAPAAFERALEGVSRISTLVRAMKEFAHPDSREKSLADLNRALTNTLAMARSELKGVAEVETRFGELPLVRCHVSDLNQVFLNLLVNAAHAVADVVGDSGRRGRITVRTTCQGDSVRVDIEDTGCGIPEAIRDRVFDPFFTTKEVGRGSGQGLAIARSIVVDKHGGTLTFETAVGKGTTFTVVVPVG